MSSYRVYRENGQIKVKFPSGSIVSYENNDFLGVLGDAEEPNNIIVYTSTSTLADSSSYSVFKNKDGGSLGSNRAEVISVLEDILLSNLDIGTSVRLDTTAGKTETTEFVHNGNINDGGAVILDSNSALIGFQSGTFVKTTENVVGGRPYGRAQIAVDNGEGTGTSISAIDVVQGNVKQYPDIGVNGDVTFSQDVEFQEDVVLTSPNGTKYRLGVDNSGNLSTQAV